ncbi:minor capsid protein [Ligilactobacillus agilis]|uniref:Phage Mu protein F like protein n=1 Tax=Ligilactobacillus agilis TaxID=1601 RepID=A0A6F9Y2B0_9LACO|nr:minor capsid protein [Ligilactobacillus agilis]GET11622.1 phage Mu protein F like protein [Ligilactobacillus agilis]
MAIPKNQKNSKYWDLRSEAEKAWIIQNIQNDEAFNAKLKDYYDRAILSISRTIEAELARLAIKENVDINEIKRRVKEFDVQEYSVEAKRVVDEADKLRSEGHEVTYEDFSKEINERLRLYNATMRINRQELLKSLIGLKLIELGANVDASLRQKLTKDYTDEIIRQAGILGEFKHPTWTSKEVAKIVMVQTGAANFSKRIWANQDALKARLDATLSIGLIQGQNPRKMAQQLRNLVSKEVTNARYATERIARTESARVQTQAQLKSFRDNGYKFCKWHAEPSACKICKEIAENDSGYGVGVYRVDEVPSLPAHPNCRCSLSAYWVNGKNNSYKNKA